MEKISAIRGFVALLMAFVWLLPSIGWAQPGPPSGPPTPPTPPKTVNCSVKTIGEAPGTLKPGDTLLVSGTCNENLVIREEVHRITLDGQGTATINGGPATDPGPEVVVIRGAGITIKGFTVTGGRIGINVVRGGTATLDGNFIQNTGRNGVNVNDSSAARVLNNTIQNNPNTGISINGGSSVDIGFAGMPADRVPSPNTIQNNGIGIAVQRSSVAQIGYNTITNNTGRGIQVTNNSHAQIGGLSNTGPSGNTISQNGSDGIRVSGSSQVNIAGNTVGNNIGRGVFVSDSSSASIFADLGATPSTTTPNTIQQNGLVAARRDGILVQSSSSASISGSTISNNTGHGVRVVRTSHASVGGNAINNSGLDGIRLEENSGVNLDQANTGSNSQFGLRCLIGAYARGSIGTLTGGSGATSFDATCINATSP